MAGLLNLETVGGRVAHLRASRGVKTPAALARLVYEKTGYEVERQTLAALERNPTHRPRAGLLRAIAVSLGAPDEEEYLLHGPRPGDSTFSAELRGLLTDLTEPQQDQILLLANEMAKETRARREQEAKQAALTERDIALLDAIRLAPEGTYDALLAQALAASRIPDAAETASAPSPETPRRSSRRAQ